MKARPTDPTLAATVRPTNQRKIHQPTGIREEFDRNLANSLLISCLCLGFPLILCCESPPDWPNSCRHSAPDKSEEIHQPTGIREEFDRNLANFLLILAHQNRTIAIASDFRVDGAKSPEIPQQEGVLGSEIAAPNRRSLATFHRTLKSQCIIAVSCFGNRAISGVRDGHRNRKSQKSLRFRCAKLLISCQCLGFPMILWRALWWQELGCWVGLHKCCVEGSKKASNPTIPAPPSQKPWRTLLVQSGGGVYFALLLGSDRKFKPPPKREDLFPVLPGLGSQSSAEPFFN